VEDRASEELEVPPKKPVAPVDVEADHEVDGKGAKHTFVAWSRKA